MRNNIFWIIGIAAVLALGYYFADIVAYILTAAVLSMLGRPMKDFFQRHIRFRGWQMGPISSSLLTLLSFYLILAGLLMVFVPTIMGQVQHLASVDYTAMGEKLKAPFADWDYQLHQFGLLESGQSLGKRIQEFLTEWFKPTMLSDFLGGFLAVAGNVVVAFASVSFILFFFLKDDTLSVSFLHTLVPAEMEAKVQHASEETSVVLTRYFGGLAVQTLIFMCIASLALWLLGVPNALLIGMMGGLFNIVPYVGPLIGIVVGCFFTLSYFIESEFSVLIPQLLKVVGAFALTQAIDNNVVGPYITSSSVKAHPLEIFIVVLVSAKLGGVVGMVIGVPVYTVLRVIARVFFGHYRLVQRWTGHLWEQKAAP